MAVPIWSERKKKEERRRRKEEGGRRKEEGGRREKEEGRKKKGERRREEEEKKNDQATKTVQRHQQNNHNHNHNHNQIFLKDYKCSRHPSAAVTRTSHATVPTSKIHKSFKQPPSVKPPHTYILSLYNDDECPSLAGGFKLET